MISKAPRRPTAALSQVNITMIPPSILSTPEQVLHYYAKQGLSIDVSVDIVEIISRNKDLILVYEDLGLNDAYIRRIDENAFQIGVNSKHHVNRQRFSMAHEYGHYLMHRDKIIGMPLGEQILHRNQDRNSIEYQANNFAAELLMPRDLVRKALISSAGSLKKAADILQVSQDALRYRVEQLGFKIK